MKYFNFQITLKADSGLFKVSLVATSILAAKQMILASENCPLNAIKSVKKLNQISIK